MPTAWVLTVRDLNFPGVGKTLGHKCSISGFNLVDYYFYIRAVRLYLLKEDYEPNQDLISSRLLVLLHEVMDIIRVTHHNRKVRSASGLRGTALIYLMVYLYPLCGGYVLTLKLRLFL